tara:strand:- start:190 stop:984 length:795 start_codon:yes stop_codon:yes gene_type:complete
MKLVIFGDSWAFGSDLKDRVNTNYASHLKTMMGATEVINMAKPGISNAAITLQLLSWLATPGALEDDPFIVIGWTSPERAEVFFDYSVSKNANLENLFWTTLGPWILIDNWCDNEASPYRPKYHKYVEFYYTMMRNELSCYVEWIQQLMLVEGLLKSKNISFHMHQAIYYNQHFVTNHEKFMHLGKDGPINTECMWNTLSSDTFLHKDKTDDMSLYGYLKEHKLGNPKLVNLPFMNEIGDHPNEYGHQLIAELLYNDMTEKGII